MLAQAASPNTGPRGLGAQASGLVVAAAVHGSAPGLLTASSTAMQGACMGCLGAWGEWTPSGASHSRGWWGKAVRKGWLTKKANLSILSA